MNDAARHDVRRDPFLAVAHEIPALARRILADTVDTVGDTPAGRTAAYHYVLRYLAAGLAVCIEADDRVSPAFAPLIAHRRAWGLDNPDCRYRFTRIDPEGTYVVRGDAPGACHTEIQVTSGHYADGDVTGWRCVDSIAGSALALGPDGGFELWVAAATPPGAANRLRLEPDASFLLVREYFADWDEPTMTLTIERVDRPDARPPLGPDELEARLGLLHEWLTTGAAAWQDMSRGLLGAPVGDVTPFLPPASASGLGGQAYGMGPWRCRPDDAVVLRLSPPTCRLWSVSLCDETWSSIQYADRQSSLNHTQAVPDADGSVTMVVCHDDPGLANWLDPGGHVAGTIAVRYLFADGLPPVTQRIVARSALPSAVGEGVATVTVDERRAALARRRRAVQRREGW